jgi:GR25 family glycosyltransferase involved in LPS biosynthesis
MIDNIKTHVINLDKRADRLSELNIPLKWERFVATDGEQYTSSPIRERGWRGCHNSHTRLMEKIVNSEDMLYLIFEDDVELCDNFNEKLVNIIETLPKDWELLFLGGHNKGEKVRYNEFVDFSL